MFSTRPGRRDRRILLSTLYGLLATFFCLPLFAAPNALGRGDWDQHLFYYAAVVKSVVEYGQLPFWNPWYCGGNILWQNPQVALLSPVYPLTLVMQLSLAMKVNIVLHYWLGLTGMHVLLTRGAGVTFLPAVVYLSVVYVASGAPALHLAVGHSVFLSAFYLPFLMFFFLRAVRERRVRDAVLGGACLALMVLNGGLHVVPMAVFAVGVLALSLAILMGSWRSLAIAALVGATGLAFSAPKLLPAIELVTSDYFYDGRLVVEGPDFVTPEMLRRAYTDPQQTIALRYSSQLHGWWEYGNYVGDVATAAFGGSLITGRFLTACSSSGRWSVYFARSVGPHTSSPMANRMPSPPAHPIRALMNDTNFYNCYEPVRLVRTADKQAPLVLARRRLSARCFRPTASRPRSMAAPRPLESC